MLRELCSSAIENLLREPRFALYAQTLGFLTIAVISPRYRRASLRLIYSTVDEEVQLSLRSLLSALLVERRVRRRRGCHPFSHSASFFRCRRSVHAGRSIEFSCIIACLREAGSRLQTWRVYIKESRVRPHRLLHNHTSPPGGRSLHESDSSRGGLSNRGQKSIQSLGHGRRGLCSWVGFFCLTCGLSANIPLRSCHEHRLFFRAECPPPSYSLAARAARAVELSKSNEGGAIRPGVCETVQRLRTPGHRLRQAHDSGPPGRSRSIKRKRPRSKTSASIAATRMGDAGDEGRCG